MDDIAIKVDHVSKVFRLPHEKQSSVKSIVVNLFRSRRGYELQQALNDVSFEVKKGEFFGIVGRNGSGKSTLLKLIAGIYTPSQGAITVNGKLTPFIELGVGFNPELTGRENVFLNGALLGFNRSEMQAMYKDIVSFAEIERFMDQKLKNYSSGMQVRLAFSIAIRAKSDILLIDEVLAVGDAGFQAKCFNYFRKLKKDGQTVVFVSHDMQSVQEFCDRALLIEDSEVKYIGETGEVASRYLLSSAQSTLSASKEDKAKISPDFEFGKVKLNKTSPTYTPKDKLSFTIDYKVKKQLDYIVGISIQKDGASLHERSTRNLDLPKSPGKHQLTLEVPAEYFNGGVHRINVAAFKRQGFELIAYVNDAANFVVNKDADDIGGLADIKSHWLKAGK